MRSDEAYDLLIAECNKYLEEVRYMFNIDGKEYWNSRGVSSFLELGRNTMLLELRKVGVLTMKNVPRPEFASKHPGFFKVMQGKAGFVTTYYSSPCIDFLRTALAHVPKNANKYKSKHEKNDFSFVFDAI